MKTFLRGVVISEVFALWLEVFYKFGVKVNVLAFVAAIPIYFIYLCGLHWLFGRIEGRALATLIGFVIGGVSGLLIEWFLVGNSPWGNSNAIQSAQLLFHAVYPVLGYRWARSRKGISVKRHIVRYMLLASLVTVAGFLFSAGPLPKLWFIFLPVIAYVGLAYFVYRLAQANRVNGL